MSVDYCVVRVSPQPFQELQRQPDILQDMMEEFYSAPKKTHIDSRDVIRGEDASSSAVLRMLYFDEFTTSLLVNLMGEESAFFLAVAGWGYAHVLKGVSYGSGEISYYSPDEAAEVAHDLKAYPDAQLESRFREGADNYRIASAGYFQDDQEILAHQLMFANLLRRFYAEAAQDGEFVLLLTV